MLPLGLYGTDPRINHRIRDPAMQQIQQEMEQAVVPWMQQVLATGLQIGAIRTDLPSGLLIAVAGGMGQAMDTWLLTQPPDPADQPMLINPC